MIPEIWRDIPGLEGRYRISNFGRVVGTKRNCIRKLQKNKDGYYRIVLKKDGGYVTLLIHRIVAEVFLENPDKLPVVNHKNEIKTDNRAENLEWCTIAYNNTYGNREYRCCRRVLQYDLSGELVKEYRTIREATKILGVDKKTIYTWCKKDGVYRGYKWAFEK